MMNVPLIFYAAPRGRRPRPVRAGASPTAGRPSARWSAPTARRPTKASSTPRPARSSGSRPSRAQRRFDLARGLAWSLYGFGTVFALHPRPGRPRRSPGATPTASSPDAPRGSSPPGISTCPPGPTGSTTARPPRSPPRACGTSPRSPASRDPAGAGRYRDATLHHPRLALHRRLPGLVHARLGRSPEARRLSLPQEAGRRRVGHVGRFLLPRSRRQGPRQAGVSILRHYVATGFRSLNRIGSLPKAPMRPQFSHDVATLCDASKWQAVCDDRGHKLQGFRPCLPIDHERRSNEPGEEAEQAALPICVPRRASADPRGPEAASTSRSIR